MTGISKQVVNLPYSNEVLYHDVDAAPLKFKKVPLTAEQKAEKKAVKKALKLLKRSEFATFVRDEGYIFNNKNYNLEGVE